MNVNLAIEPVKILVSGSDTCLRSLRGVLSSRCNVTFCSPAQLMSKLAVQYWDVVLIASEGNILAWGSLIKMIKAHNSPPIICLTSDISINDINLGIEAGIDEYIYENVSDQELQYNLNCAIEKFTSDFFGSDRMAKASQSRPELVSDKSSQERKKMSLLIDVRSKLIYVNGKELLLSPIEFELLTVLSSDPGKVISVSEIIDRVWPDRTDTLSSDVQQYVYLLRKKLKSLTPEPAIKTIKGFGYKLDSSIIESQIDSF